jgi:phosphoadenosine phosphosulfate reductase
MYPNPLYEADLERIGCWLCPAALQSEFAGLKATHPGLYNRWITSLNEWAEENNFDKRYVDWGFWRWKRHPPKMLEMAREHNIPLLAGNAAKKEIKLQVVRGRSPCGLSYSIEANLSAPQNHPFSLVASALGILGEVKYAEDLGAAVIKTEKGRITAFANGQILIIAGKEQAEQLLQDVCETILRAQLCTRCRICEKNCSRGAISVAETMTIDARLCNHCKKCARGCIAADQAAKTYARLIEAGS